MKTKRYCARGFGLGFISIAIVAVVSAVVMLLWNALFPVIFGIVKITYWQALGILILARILFGSFRCGERSFHHHPFSRYHRDNPLHEKWMKMTPEERKEFINKRREYMRNHFFGKESFFTHGCDFDKTDDSKKSDDE